MTKIYGMQRETIDLIDLQGAIGLQKEDPPEPAKTEDFRYICERILVSMHETMEGIKEKLITNNKGFQSDNKKAFNEQYNVETDQRIFE